jgi:cell division septation protein DedD
MKYFRNIWFYWAFFFFVSAVFAEDAKDYGNTEIQATQANDATFMPPSRTNIPQNPTAFNESEEKPGTLSVISIKVRPGIPDPKSTKMYRVQVGSFSNTDLAWRFYDRLKHVGLNPAFEPHGKMYRVVIPGLKAVNIPEIIRQLELAGVYEAWVREEN